jgi:serpin B
VSRESEKLYEAIGRAGDGQIEEAQGPRRRRSLRWIAPLAAVLAFAAALTVFLSGPGKGSAYAVAEAKYPKEYQIMTAPVQAETLESFLRRSLPRLLAGQEGENQVCSPLNIYMALSMLAEATGGESRAQLLELLDSPDIETQRQTARQLWERNYYSNESGKSLLASSLWLDSGLHYKRETVKLLAEEYYASVFRGDLGSEKLEKALQEWLNEQTGGLLKEQADNVTLPPDAVLALAATVYFKSTWSFEFQERSTEEQIFAAPKGETRCPFMHGSEEGSYYWGEGFTAAVKAFSNGYRMLFVLPGEGASPETLLAEGEFMDFLTGGVNAWGQRETVTLKYAVPRFDLTCETDLKPVLADLGVTDVLDPALADFSAITDTPAAVTAAQHACRVKVDEEGCEAAAFTVIVAAGGMPLEPPREVEFTLDRPFLFAILSREGSPLFVGVVNDPTA